MQYLNHCHGAQLIFHLLVFELFASPKNDEALYSKYLIKANVPTHLNILGIPITNIKNTKHTPA